MRSAAVVLAAGASTRLGSAKQLATLDGEPLVTRAVHVAAEAADDVVLVTGHDPEPVADAGHAAGAPRLTIAWAPGWAEGMGVSVGVGIAAARSLAERVVVLPCDLPRLSAADLTRLLSAVEAPDNAAAARHAEGVGLPAAFGAGWYDRLVALPPERGAAALLRGAPGVRAVGIDAAADDVDTPGDAERLGVSPS